MAHFNQLLDNQVYRDRYLSCEDNPQNLQLAKKMNRRSLFMIELIGDQTVLGRQIHQRLSEQNFMELAIAQLPLIGNIFKGKN